MARFANSKGATLAVCLALVIVNSAGCGKLFGEANEGNGRNVTGNLPDGAVCTKDPVVIKNVMLAPPTCSATAPCPCGTFCSSQTGGNCIADCVDDTWCAPGYTCSPFGQCLKATTDGGTSDGGALALDPACPRNTTLLNTIKTTPRACPFDDTCPYGSYCNHLKGTCDWSCKVDTDCASMNTPGHTFACGCLGQCVEIAAPRPLPAVVQPSLEVTPKGYLFDRPATITTPNWGDLAQRKVTLVVAAQTLTMSGTTITGPTAAIQVNPGPNTLVQCPMTAGADAGSGTLAATPCSVAITPSTFKIDGTTGIYRSAPIILTVAPASTAPTATNWSITLESNDLGNMPQVVTLRYEDPSPTPTTPTFTTPATPDTTFVGSGFVELSMPTIAPTIAPGPNPAPLPMTVKIPVKARYYGGTPSAGVGTSLVLYDDTHQLSPSGKLVLTLSTNPGAADLYMAPGATTDTSLSDNFTGTLFQRLTALQVLQDSPTTANEIKGTFSRSIYADYLFNQPVTGTSTSALDTPANATFSVSRTSAAAIGACSTSTDCAVGSTCDLGFCSYDPPHQFLAEIPSANPILLHRRMNNWGVHRPGEQTGFGSWGLYLPGSWAFNSAGTDYQLHGPMGSMSGELQADLLAGTTVAFANLQSRAVPLIAQHDAQTGNSASNLLRGCMTDLLFDRPTAPIAIFDPAIFDFFPTCISVPRVGFSMADDFTFQRVLRGWLTVHSFIAREGLEESQLEEATGNIGVFDFSRNQSVPAIPLETLLSTAESGLGLLLDVSSNNANAFQFVSQRGTFWTQLDSRPTKINQACNRDVDCTGTTSQRTMACVAGKCATLSLAEVPNHDQPISIQPFMLEAATSYLKLLEAYLNRIGRETYGSTADNSPSDARRGAINRFGTGMRLVIAVEQLAMGLNLMFPCPSSNVNCGGIANRFQAAYDELNVVRRRVLAQANALKNNTNPFGIPEDDVPLFFGDPTGTSSRYFAASDYLIDGWAVPAVAQTAATLDAARAAWIAKTAAVVQDELNQHNRAQEIAELMSRYGTAIINACGSIQVPNTEGGISTLDPTEVIPYFQDKVNHPFSNDTCFVDASCTGTPGALETKIALRNAINNAFLDSAGNLQPADVPGTNSTMASRTAQSEICKIQRLFYPLPNDAFIAQMSSMGCSTASGIPCIVRKESDGNLYVISALDTGTEIPFAAFYGPIKRQDVGSGNFYPFATNNKGPVTIPGGVTLPPFGTGSGENIYSFHNLRTDPANETNNPFNRISDDFNSGKGVCARGIGGRLTRDYPLPDPHAFPPLCYKGALGVAQQELRTNDLRITRAKTVLDANQGGLDDLFATCNMIDSNTMDLTNRSNSYNTMKSHYQWASGTVGAIMSGVEGGISTGSIGGGIAKGLVSLGLNLWGAHVEDEAAKLQALELKVARDEKSQECWNNFRAQRRTMVTAMTDIQIAASEVNAQAIRYSNLQAETIATLNDGLSNLAREQSTQVGTLSHHFWVDEKVDKYRKELEWARRLTFLAMRAVEYEFQQSLPFRSAIAAATNPVQLEDVLRGLKQDQAARTINRRRPDEASIVLSLRDDVLGVRSQTSAPAGERAWTPAQRFASRLWDSRYAVRDSKGNYLGQGLPFNLGPTDVLETRCGERLWRATATLQGDGLDSSRPGASVLLLKRNTFASQYCNGEGPPRQVPTSNAPRMQIGTIHTTADLFHPGAAVDLSDANQYTAAMLYPWFNVRKTDFYKTTYQDGASEELAGRGLYGDYVLLFPKQMLDDSFKLDRVEDVLLRLDYLSVDNLAQ